MRIRLTSCLLWVCKHLHLSDATNPRCCAIASFKFARYLQNSAQYLANVPSLLPDGGCTRSPAAALNLPIKVLNKLYNDMLGEIELFYQIGPDVTRCYFACELNKFEYIFRVKIFKFSISAARGPIGCILPQNNIPQDCCAHPAG